MFRVAGDIITFLYVKKVIQAMSNKSIAHITWHKHEAMVSTEYIILYMPPVSAGHKTGPLFDKAHSVHSL